LQIVEAKLQHRLIKPNSVETCATSMEGKHSKHLVWQWWGTEWCNNRCNKQADWCRAVFMRDKCMIIIMPR